MTSSFENFGNVIGTPRDSMPDISDTNYLQTEADLTEAVNKEIDENIKDTKAFYDQMVDLERLRAQGFDKNMKALADIVGKTSDIAKAWQAHNADQELQKAKFSQDKNFLDELKDAEDDQNLLLIKTKNFFLEQEKKGLIIGPEQQAEFQEALADIQIASDPDSDMKSDLSTITDAQIKVSINSVLQALGHGKLTDAQQALDVQEFAARMVRNKIHFDMAAKGYDVYSGRYRKQFLNKIDPKVTTHMDTMFYSWQADFNTNRKAKDKEILDDRISENFLNLAKTQVQGQDLTLFLGKENGILNQIALEQFPGQENARTKALYYYGDQVADAIENDADLIPYGKMLLEALPYSDKSTRTDFESFNAYVESIDFKKEPKRFKQATEFSKRIEDAIETASKTEDTDTKAAYKQAVDDFLKNNLDPVLKIAGDEKRSLTQFEKFRIITAFTADEDLYNPADPNKQIPERLKTLFQDVGDLDPDVKLRLDYAGLVNGKSDIIQQMILDRKKANGDNSGINTDDLLLARTLSDVLSGELAVALTGDESALATELRAEGSVSGFLAKKVEDLKLRFNNGEFDGFARKLNLLAAEQNENLRKAYAEDNSLLYSEIPHVGEEAPLDKAVLFIKSGGVLHPEVKEYFKKFQRVLRDADGNPLSTQEIILQRLISTGRVDKDDVYGERLNDLDFISKEEKIYTLTNGLHGVHNIISVEGGKYAKDVLAALEHPEAHTGNFGNRQTGYDFYNTGPARTGNPFTNVGANIFGKSIKDRQLKYIAKVAEKHPKVIMGKYGITGEQFLEIYNQEGFVERVNENQRFDENFQDYFAMEFIRYNLNKRNSIRGMNVDGQGRFTTSLIHFTRQELDALESIFPKLKGMTYLQLQSLSKPIADLLLNDIEKAQKKDKELGTGKKFERQARLKRYGENLKKNLGLNNIQIPPSNDRDQTEGIISTP